MQSTSSTVSISFNDNHYITDTFVEYHVRFTALYASFLGQLFSTCIIIHLFLAHIRISAFSEPTEIT